MTTYLTCTKCGYKFAVSTTAYLAGELVCPGCGIDMLGNYVESRPMKRYDTRYKKGECSLNYGENK